VWMPTDSSSEPRRAVVSSQSPVRLESVMRGKRTVSTISAFPRDLDTGGIGVFHVCDTVCTQSVAQPHGLEDLSR
jgi:hypothetical protein